MTTQAKAKAMNLNTTSIDSNEDWSRPQERTPLDIEAIANSYDLFMQTIKNTCHEEHPFIMTVIAGAPLSQVNYLAETHYARKIDTVISELKELREIGTMSRAKEGYEVDLAQVERKKNWLQVNLVQKEEAEALMEALQAVYKKYFNKVWTKPDASKKAGKARSVTSTQFMLDHILDAAAKGTLKSSDTTLEAVFAKPEKTMKAAPVADPSSF